MNPTESYRRILGRMGYYDYQNGLIYRHLNQGSGWDSHLEHCRNYIMAAAEKFSPSRITVLGSGWLLELPLSELAETVEKIILVDIIHPPEVIRQAGTMKNIEIAVSDVSGGLIEKVYNTVRSRPFFRKLDTIRGMAIPCYTPDIDPGMVISLNLLTQLEVLPVRFLEKKAKIDEEEITEFRKAVQQKHLEFLSRQRSLIISDYEEEFTSRSGETHSVKTLLTDLPAGTDREEWTWDFDLKGADNFNSRSIMKVIAMTL